MTVREATDEETETANRILKDAGFEEPACDHGVTFDQEAAERVIREVKTVSSGDAVIDFIAGPVDAVAVIRKRWPRGWFTKEKPCPKGCGFVGIAYASYAHYIAGDW